MVTTMAKKADVLEVRFFNGLGIEYMSLQRSC